MAAPDLAPQLGTLTWLPAHEHLDLIGEPVAAALPGLWRSDGRGSSFLYGMLGTP